MYHFQFKGIMELKVFFFFVFFLYASIYSVGTVFYAELYVIEQTRGFISNTPLEHIDMCINDPGWKQQ